MKRGVSVILSCLLIVALSACQTTALATRDFLWDGESKRRVVLMPVDIELSLLNAGGVNEPNAAWTKTGTELAIAALHEKMGESSAKLVTSDLNKIKADPDSVEVQLVKLHGEVGGTILAHKYVPVLALPTKSETFDWTLGDKAKALAQKYDADYAMFVYVRDSYTSAGRAAVILVAAVLGVGVQGGAQIGFASLVDLKTGEITWFNRLARGQGDLRQETGAKDTVAALLANFPK
jgi:hypothetical protein